MFFPPLSTTWRIISTLIVVKQKLNWEAERRYKLLQSNESLTNDEGGETKQFPLEFDIQV